MKPYTRSRINFIFQCYLQSLCQNETIKNRVVKTDCIKKYLKAAKTFACAARIENPTQTDQGIEDPIIKILLDEHKEWDAVMNRREPVSEEMFDVLHQQRDLDPSSESNAVADWLTIGRQAGLRISEYGQEEAALNRNQHFALNDFGQSRAFIMSDFIFFGKGGRHLFYTDSSELRLEDISSAKIRWRTQKNKEKDEMIWYTRNDLDTSRCVVRAMLCIRKRAQDLQIPAGHPIGAYKCDKGHKFLTNNLMAASFKNAATIAHNITDPKSLSKYTSHSVRVMACVILFAKGKNTDFIKYRLRWKSDCFQMYLRHVPVQAAEHNEATTDCSFFV